MSRWNQASILASTFWLDDRLLFQPKKICEVSKTDWDSLIDVPLLPLTTDYMPSSFWKESYRQMNPSGFDTFQLKKKSILEMTIQKLSQNFQIVSQTGSIAVTLDSKYKMNTNMSLCEFYYQSNNLRNNVYILNNELLLGDQCLQLNYLFYDCLVNCFKPRYVNHSLLDFKMMQNFNDDYQNDFNGRDILSIIFPMQKYVILYNKRDMELMKAAWYYFIANLLSIKLLSSIYFIVLILYYFLIHTLFHKLLCFQLKHCYESDTIMRRCV